MRVYTHSMKMKGTSKEHKFEVKKAVVLEAIKNGIKPTVRRHAIARNTIRTWLRRFRISGNEGLKDQRNGPDHIPHKTSQAIEAQVIAARREAPCYGPKRLQFFFKLSCSKGAIQRILKVHHLTRKNRKKKHKKQDLRQIKQEYKSLSHIQMDVKHLRDMPNYWGQQKEFQLPKYQYTMRDVKSGMLFLGFSDELSELNARTMVEQLLQHLYSHLPFPMQEIIIQTDNGAEFGGTNRKTISPFTKLIENYGAQQLFIPPSTPNANADVESLHDTIEEEFFNLTQFSSREDFFHKAESYRLFYNLKRPNYSKGAKTPFLISQQEFPHSNVTVQAALFKVLDLDKINILLTVSGYNKGGQSLPVFPGIACVR